MNLEKITPDNYKVPKGEERSYHCIIECVQYDPKTGKKISKPRLQKFGKKMFEAHVYSSLKKQGYKVDILHNPVEWQKQQIAENQKRLIELAEAKKAEEEKRLQEAKAEEEKRFQERVAAEVARQMALLKGETGESKTGESKTETEEKKKAGRPKKEQ